MTSLIQFRGDTAANWASVNPILAARELGVITDTGGYKIGDGVKTWNLLPSATLSPELQVAMLNKQSEPSSVDTDKLALYAASMAGRMLPRIKGPSGLGSFLQPFLARNKIGYWCPPGNATTAPGVLGYTAHTITSVATIRNVATTNIFTRMRRVGYTVAATASLVGTIRVAVNQITLGGITGGGFTKVMRFGISDPVVVTDARMFMGISSTATAATNVEPSTLKNMVGIGHGASDTNMKLYATGTNTCTPIDLGSNFPSNTTNTDVYELSLFAPPGDDSISWEVTRINTGHRASGTIQNNGGTTLPANSLLLTYLWGYRANGAGAVATGYDLMSDYIETDN